MPKMLRITAKRDAFWRAGRRWTSEPTEVRAGAFDKGQLAALKGEPMLVVTEFDAPEPKKTEPAETAAKKGAAKKGAAKKTTEPAGEGGQGPDDN